MKNKTKLISLSGLVVLALGGCVGDFALFTYTAEMEFDNVGVVDNEPVVDVEGNEVPSGWTAPVGSIVTGNPAVDIISTIIAKTGSIEAAKFLTAAIAGDPASIAALRASGFTSVKVTKKVLPIRGRKFEEARIKAEAEADKDSK